MIYIFVTNKGIQKLNNDVIESINVVYLWNSKFTIFRFFNFINLIIIINILVKEYGHQVYKGIVKQSRYIVFYTTWSDSS